MKETKVPINTEFIKLQDILKWTGAAQTGGHAKILIQEGLVTVNGDVCLMRGKKLRPGDTVAMIETGETFSVCAED